MRSDSGVPSDPPSSPFGGDGRAVDRPPPGPAGSGPPADPPPSPDGVPPGAPSADEVPVPPASLADELPAPSAADPGDPALPTGPAADGPPAAPTVGPPATPGAAAPAGTDASGAEPPARPTPSPAALEIETEHLRRLLEKASARLDLQTEETQAAQRRADEHAAVARRQTEMADELHAENRVLRQGEIAKALDPLVRGIARFADDLDRIGAGEPTAQDVTYLRGQVDELLHDAGVTQLRPAPGEPFDAQTQQAAGTVATDDEVLNRTVAEVRRTGLRRDDGRMLRPVEVVVHRYVAPPAAQSPDAPGVDQRNEESA